MLYSTNIIYNRRPDPMTLVEPLAARATSVEFIAAAAGDADGARKKNMNNNDDINNDNN